jgi:hypothetical protein
MSSPVGSLYRRCRLGLSAAIFLALVSACGSDQLTPPTEAPGDDALTGNPLTPSPVDSSGLPADSTAGPADSTAGPADSTAGPTDSTTTSIPPDSTASLITQPGIVFGSYNMRNQYLNSIFNGSMQGLEPDWLISELKLARAVGGRTIVKMAGGLDERIQNADGTFSLSKWKALIYRFKTLSLSSYIDDGTLMGVFLIDEPQNKSKWGGKIIPHSTVEEMARYSKSLWPKLTTFARVAPTWLAQTTITYTYLDAGWYQYNAKYMGDISTGITNEVAAAKKKGLGLVVGLNVLSGGNGSSGLTGTSSQWYKMSATEIRNYGNVLLNQTYACGFFNWTYTLGGADYYARTDIKSALASLSTKAKAHVKTSCRQ